MYGKFIKAFGTDMILTTNKHADDIIGSFNEGEAVDLSDKGSNIENYRFFHVKEFKSTTFAIFMGYAAPKYFLTSGTK